MTSQCTRHITALLSMGWHNTMRNSQSPSGRCEPRVCQKMFGYRPMNTQLLSLLISSRFRARRPRDFMDESSRDVQPSLLKPESCSCPLYLPSALAALAAIRARAGRRGALRSGSRRRRVPHGRGVVVVVLGAAAAAGARSSRLSALGSSSAALASLSGVAAAGRVVVVVLGCRVPSAVVGRSAPSAVVGGSAPGGRRSPDGRAVVVVVLGAAAAAARSAGLAALGSPSALASLSSASRLAALAAVGAGRGVIVVLRRGRGPSSVVAPARRGTPRARGGRVLLAGGGRA